MERKPNRFWPNFFRIKYIILKLPTISFRAPHPTPPAPDLIFFILFLYMNISFYLCSWAERAGRTEKMRQRKDHQLWCKSNTKQNATFTSMDLFSFPWLSSDVFVCFSFQDKPDSISTFISNQTNTLKCDGDFTLLPKAIVSLFKIVEIVVMPWEYRIFVRFIVNILRNSS